MLRCLKWLPIACIAAFVACLGLGWILSPGKAVTVVVPPPPQESNMALILLFYDMNGRPIAAKPRNAKGAVDFGKWEHQPPHQETIDVSPEDKRYKERLGQPIVWRTQQDYVKWLDHEFLGELNSRGANAQSPEWTKLLHKFHTDAGKVSCDYPIILDTK